MAAWSTEHRCFPQPSWLEVAHTSCREHNGAEALSGEPYFNLGDCSTGSDIWEGFGLNHADRCLLYLPVAQGTAAMLSRAIRIEVSFRNGRVLKVTKCCKEGRL